jgi:hypothetical protein
MPTSLSSGWYRARHESPKNGMKWGRGWGYVRKRFSEIMVAIVDTNCMSCVSVYPSLCPICMSICSLFLLGSPPLFPLVLVSFRCPFAEQNVGLATQQLFCKLGTLSRPFPAPPPLPLSLTCVSYFCIHTRASYACTFLIVCVLQQPTPQPHLSSPSKHGCLQLHQIAEKSHLMVHPARGRMTILLRRYLGS